MNVWTERREPFTAVRTKRGPHKQTSSGHERTPHLGEYRDKAGALACLFNYSFKKNTVLFKPLN